MAGELEAFLESMGIEPVGGAATDEDDPPIYLGTAPKKTRDRKLGGTAASRAPDGVRIETSGGGDETRRLSEYEREFYSLNDQALRDLQHKLFLGGFYGSADPEDIRWGDFDESTAKAYGTALGRAATFYKAGVKKTLQQVLDDAARNPSAKEKAGGGRKRAPLTVELTNPEDMKAAANRAAPEEIARRLTDKEMAQVSSEYHGQEAGAQRAAYSAAEGGGTVTAPPSFAAFLQNRLREIDPRGATETKAVELANVFFNMFSEPEGLS